MAATKYLMLIGREASIEYSDEIPSAKKETYATRRKIVEGLKRSREGTRGATRGATGRGEA